MTTTRNPSASMPHNQLSQAVSLLFWGALIVAIDFRLSPGAINSGTSISGPGFDIIPDVIGMALITVSMKRIRELAPDHPINDAAVPLALFIGALTLVLTFAPGLSWLSSMTETLMMIGVVVGSFMLWETCRNLELREAKEAWLTSVKLGSAVALASLVFAVLVYVVDDSAFSSADLNALSGALQVSFLIFALVALIDFVVWVRAVWITIKSANAQMP